MPRIIVARYPGTCKECGVPFPAGERINFGGKGAVTHEDCRPLAVVRDRYGYDSVMGGYSASGQRCEDAPCCGCC